MSPFYTVIINNQTIWLFNLNASNTERTIRQDVLDTYLTQFFQRNITEKSADCWRNFRQFIQIVHTKGQPAKATFLATSGEKITVTLAISYALPLVAVSLSSQKVGLDLCALADFETMTEAEKCQFFCDYFPHLTINTDNSILAKLWSLLESGLKYQQITLAEAVENPSFLQSLTHLNITHKKILFKEKVFWLTFITDVASPSFS